MTLLTEFKLKPFWLRHFRPITQDDHGMTNASFYKASMYNKPLSKILSTPLHSIVIQTKNYKYFCHIESSPFHLATWDEGASFQKQSIVTDREKRIAHEQTRIGPNRPQPINQSERVFNNQSGQGILNQSGRSVFVLTKHYWSVTNTYDWSISTKQKIILIIFWLAKNGKDKIRTPHWWKK